MTYILSMNISYLVQNILAFNNNLNKIFFTFFCFRDKYQHLTVDYTKAKTKQNV